MKRATTPTKTTKIMQKTRITPRGNIFVLDSRKKRVRTKKKKNNGSNVKNLWEKPTFGQSCCFDLESKSNSLQKRFHQELKNKKKKTYS